VQRRVRRGQRRAGQLAQRLSIEALGHQGRHHRPGHPQASDRQLLPRLADRAETPGRTGSRGGGGSVLRRRGLHPSRRRRGAVHGHRGDLQVPGLRAGQVPRRGRGRLSQPAPRRRALHLRLGRRPDPEGQRGRAHRQRGRRHRHWRQRPKGIERSWASTSSPPRTGRAGPPSCAAWSLEDSRASSWSSPMPTAA